MLASLVNNTIRELMRREGKTQKDLADHFNKSLGYVSARFNNRDGSSWELNEIESISKWLNVNEEAILTGDIYDAMAA